MTVGTLPVDSPRTQPVAPVWHTAVLVALFVGLTIAGALFQRQAQTSSPAPAHPSVLPIYLGLIAAEWGLVLFIARAGLTRKNLTIRELVGGHWGSARHVLTDAALGIGLWAVWKLVTIAWDRVQGQGAAASIDSYLPQGVLEAGVWIGLSLTAGFCEELAFRGYFQRQFEAWSRSPWVALVLQASLFGISHGYQGVMACVRIAAYGALFGMLALWRRSLRPGMIAHALTDVLGGLFRI